MIPSVPTSAIAPPISPRSDGAESRSDADTPDFALVLSNDDGDQMLAPDLIFGNAEPTDEIPITVSPDDPAKQEDAVDLRQVVDETADVSKANRSEIMDDVSLRTAGPPLDEPVSPGVVTLGTGVATSSTRTPQTQQTVIEGDTLRARTQPVSQDLTATKAVLSSAPHGTSDEIALSLPLTRSTPGEVPLGITGPAITSPKAIAMTPKPGEQASQFRPAVSTPEVHQVPGTTDATKSIAPTADRTSTVVNSGDDAHYQTKAVPAAPGVTQSPKDIAILSLTNIGSTPRNNEARWQSRGSADATYHVTTPPQPNPPVAINAAPTTGTRSVHQDVRGLIAAEISEIGLRVEAGPPSTERTTAVAAAAGPTHGADQARQIAQQLVAVTPPRAPGTAEITLQPEELGRVRMSLILQDGVMAVAIHADRPETLDLMRRHIDQLVQTYRQMGFENTSFSFSGSTTQDQSNTSSNLSFGDMPDDPETALQSSTTSTSTDGRLDLRM